MWLAFANAKKQGVSTSKISYNDFKIDGTVWAALKYIYIVVVEVNDLEVNVLLVNEKVSIW